jgi:hypothetical protein
VLSLHGPGSAWPTIPDGAGWRTAATEAGAGSPSLEKLSQYQHRRLFVQRLVVVPALGALDPSWTLSLIEVILENEPLTEVARWHLGGEKLIRLALRVYNDPITDIEMRRRAMDCLTDSWNGMQAKLRRFWVNGIGGNPSQGHDPRCLMEMSGLGNGRLGEKRRRGLLPLPLVVWCTHRANMESCTASFALCCISWPSLCLCSSASKRLRK